MATKPNRNGMQPYNTSNGEYMEKDETNEFDVNSYISNFKDINEALNEVLIYDNALGMPLRITNHAINRINKRYFANYKALIETLLHPKAIEKCYNDKYNKRILFGKKCNVIINWNNGNIITVMRTNNFRRKKGR